jgi:hypothetical protein
MPGVWQTSNGWSSKWTCCRCNSIKTDAAAILDPCHDAFAQHLEVLADGRIKGLSPAGRELIRV